MQRVKAGEKQEQVFFIMLYELERKRGRETEREGNREREIQRERNLELRTRDGI